jgi:hypothetical protein
LMLMLDSQADSTGLAVVSSPDLGC